LRVALRLGARFRGVSHGLQRICTALPQLLIRSIAGHSMYPALANGDCAIVVCRTHDLERQPRVGDIVVFRHGNSARDYVKRVAAVAGDVAPGTSERVPPNCIWVSGDNARWSVDSTQIGPIPVDRVVGTIALRIPIGAPPPISSGAGSDLPWVV